RTVNRAFGARSVVTQNVDEKRVSQLSHLIHRLDDAAYFVVGVLEEIGEVLRLAAKKALLSGVEIIPCRNRFRPPGQSRSAGNHLHCKLPRKDLFPVAVPTHVETSRVASPPFERGLVRAVRRARS